MTPSARSVEIASELVNSHWNGDYCPRESAINAIAMALDAQVERDAREADYYANNSITAKNIAKRIRQQVRP